MFWTQLMYCVNVWTSQPLGCLATGGEEPTYDVLIFSIIFFTLVDYKFDIFFKTDDENIKTTFFEVDSVSFEAEYKWYSMIKGEIYQLTGVPSFFNQGQFWYI